MEAAFKTKGLYYDLAPMFEALNERFFKQKNIFARLRWGKKRSGSNLSKRSIRLGSYQPSSKIITIHPCLDQAIVPSICVERILFHEMLHQHFPAKKCKSGRMLVHYREFYEFEKKYPYLKEADLWIKANLQRLLSF